MTSKQVKNTVRDQFEWGFDMLHRAADVVTFPLAPVDGAIHGIARGVHNWLLDEHPKEKKAAKGVPNYNNCPPQNNNTAAAAPPPSGPPSYPSYPSYPPNYPYWGPQPQPFKADVGAGNNNNINNGNNNSNTEAFRIGNGK